MKYKTNFRCFLSVSEAYCLGHLNLSNRGISEVKRIIIGKGEIRILNKMNFCPTLLFLRQSGQRFGKFSEIKSFKLTKRENLKVGTSQANDNGGKNRILMLVISRAQSRSGAANQRLPGKPQCTPGTELMGHSWLLAGHRRMKGLG